MNSKDIDPEILKRGILFAVDRQAAKSLFGARGDQALRDIVTGFAGKPSLWSDETAVDCQGNWHIIDQCLNEMKGETPLDQCILGGRPMYQGPDMTVTMVRPDLVPHLAEGLDQIDVEGFRELALNCRPAAEDLAATLLRIRCLYRTAAEHRQAIVFAVEH